MAASIGSVTCQFCRGVAPGLAKRTRLFSTPGVDGHGAQTLGQGAAPFLFRCQLTDTDGNIDTWQSNMEGTQGTIVTIENDIGDQYTNCFIQDIKVAKSKKAVLVASGATQYTLNLDVIGVKIN